MTKHEKDPRSRTTRTAIRTLTVLGAVVGVGALFGAVALTRGRVFVLNGPDSPMPIDLVPQVERADSDAWEVVSAVDLPVATRILSSLPGLVLGLTLAAAALLVASMLRQVASGESFSLAARRTLGRLSLTLIVGGVASAVLDVVALLAVQAAMRPLREAWTSELMGDSPRVPVSATPSIPVFIIVLGVVAAAFMYALQDGAALEKEAEGVI